MTPREGPATPDQPPIGYDNFHHMTRATYRPCPLPDREPDFVSPGRSVYWDLGDRVVRASDHWSGQNGRGEIGGCLWTYEGACRSGRWEVGSCSYADFSPRVRIFPTRNATPEDRIFALLLKTSGGGLDPSRIDGGPVPDWVRVAPRGTVAAGPAEAALSAQPDLLRVLTADESVVRRILDAGEVPLPSRMS